MSDGLATPNPRVKLERIKSDDAFGISFGAALLAAGIAGFVSLGYEIVWYRLFSFTTAGLAKSFAFLLGAFLAGIGAGSLTTNRICSKITRPQSFVRILVAAVFGANLLGFLVGPILFALVVRVSYLWTLVPIGIAAACLGAVFPMLCHISMPADERSGPRMSYLYLSNILGSALGGYLTGFVLMDSLPLRQVSVVLALLGLALGHGIATQGEVGQGPVRWRRVGCVGRCAACRFGFRASVSRDIRKDAHERQIHFRRAVWHGGGNKSGVIAVTQTGTVFGGGIYDGRFNVSLVNDTNGIQRAFALSYYHPDPKEVLMIGLSSGSWAASHRQSSPGRAPDHR